MKAGEGMISDKGRRLKIFLGYGAVIAVVLIVGRLLFPPQTSAPKEPAPPAPRIEERARALTAAMSDEEKIGQMVMIGVQGTKLDEPMRAMLENCKFGGVILFDRNMETPEQVAALNGSLQEAAFDATGLPLFIAVDQEGGSVARMTEHMTPIPGAARLGREGKPEKARQYARQTASELRGMGFNVNFAPVLDLGLAGGRSYGTRQDVVTKFAAAACGGYAEGKIIFALKHFPGIGKSKVDLHEDIDSVAAPLAALEAEDIAPFRAVMQSMWMEDFFIMVSHLKYPALDEENPASLSRRIITDLLKGKYGFRGLVVTDDLEMGALTNHFSFDELGVKAAAAGADLVLVCHEYDHAAAVYQGMLQALREGKLARGQIDASVEKIVAMKLRLRERMKMQ